MRKYLLTFFISLTVALSAPLVFWRFSPKSNDLTYLLDCLFLSGALFFTLGTITALFTTSRLHYYLHLRDKWKGKVENDSGFEKDEKKRETQTRLGAITAFSGLITVVASGIIGHKIGY